MVSDLIVLWDGAFVRKFHIYFLTIVSIRKRNLKIMLVGLEISLYSFKGNEGGRFYQWASKRKNLK